MAKTIEVKPILSILGKPIEVPDLTPMGDLLMVNNPDGVKGMDGKILKQPKMKEATTADIPMTMIRLFPRNKLNMSAIMIAMKVKERVDAVKNGHFTLEDTEFDWLINSLKDDGIGVQLFGFDVVNIIKAFGGKAD